MIEEVFSRQLALFPEGFLKVLREKAVLVAGLGGLGCSAAESLARLGIGKLYLLDHDTVDLPALNRQIFYSYKDVGRPKTEVAAERLKDLLPDLEVVPIRKELDETFELPEDVSAVVDAFDNWRSRFLLEKICAKKGVFFVHAGIYGLFGQVTTIVPDETPSLSEVFKGAQERYRPPVAVPICMTLGTIQALEVVKNLLNIKENLAGKLLVIDLLTYTFELIPLKKVEKRP